MNDIYDYLNCFLHSYIKTWMTDAIGINSKKKDVCLISVTLRARRYIRGLTIYASQCDVQLLWDGKEVGIGRQEWKTRVHADMENMSRITMPRHGSMNIPVTPEKTVWIACVCPANGIHKTFQTSNAQRVSIFLSKKKSLKNPWHIIKLKSYEYKH